jgi:hypothetical protein
MHAPLREHSSVRCTFCLMSEVAPAGERTKREAFVIGTKGMHQQSQSERQEI